MLSSVITGGASVSTWPRTVTDHHDLAIAGAFGGFLIGRSRCGGGRFRRQRGRGNHQRRGRKLEAQVASSSKLRPFPQGGRWPTTRAATTGQRVTFCHNRLTTG